MCGCIHCGVLYPQKKWCNMPGIHQTRLSTCGLTLSLQLLKYVVWNYWNMYATSVPRNTAAPAPSHPPASQELYSTSRLTRLTMQSHHSVRGIETMSREQRHLTPPPRLPSICMKMEEIWDMDLPQMWELNRGAFCMLSWSTDWSLPTSLPLGKRLDGRTANRKEIRWIIGSQLKTAAASLAWRITRAQGAISSF